MFGCALPNSHSRQSCHPSRWLLVLKESLWYTLHMMKGKLPTNHVSSKYRMNFLIRGNCRAATLTACQAGRTKQTINAAVTRRSQLMFYWITPSLWRAPLHFLSLHLPHSVPPLLPHTHTIHQLSLFIKSHTCCS